MPGHLVGARAQRPPARRRPARAVPVPPAAAAGRARRARARRRAAANRRRALRAGGQRRVPASRLPRRAGACWPTATTARSRDWLGELPGDADLDVPGDRDALHGRAGGDHRGRGHGLLRARLELRRGALAQHRRRRGRADRRHRRRAARADRRPTPTCRRSRRRTSSCACATAPAATDRELRARHAIVATKAFDAARLIRDLPADTRSALTSIPYGPTVVMAMLTNETRPMPWDDLYALATPKRAFSMLFNTVNVLRPRSAVRAPGGSLMVYRSGHAALDDVRAARRRRGAGVPRRPLRDLPGGARHRGGDDPAQAAAHAALRRAGPLGAAAGARAAARPHPPRGRLPGRRLHRHGDLERAGGRAGRAHARCRPPRIRP